MPHTPFARSVDVRAPSPAPPPPPTPLLVHSANRRRSYAGLRTHRAPTAPVRRAAIQIRYRRWRSITNDPDVLALVRHGLRFVFRCGAPAMPRRAAPIFRGSPDQMIQLREQLDQWLRNAIIEPSNDPRDLPALLFPVAKAHSTKARWVLDSSRFNDHLRRQRFKMEGIAHIRHLIQPGDWMCSVDLQDAFLQVPVHRQHRRFLAFEAFGQRYRFCRMSFGTSVAPFTFTRLLKPVLAHLHRLGIRVSAYLDDLIVIAKDRRAALEAVHTVINLLEWLGLPVNYDKSNTVPTRRLQHLGMVFDSANMTLSVPRDKLRAILKDAKRLLTAHESGAGATARQLAGVAGKISAAAPGLRQAADFRRHSIQRCAHYALRASRGDWDFKVQLSRSAIRDLRWWTTWAPLGFNGVALHLPKADATLCTDASETGYGAVLHLRDGRSLTVHGFWRRHEAARSSNWREATALTRGWFAFASRIRRFRHLRVESDNMTAVSILRRFGSRHRHLGLALEPLLRAALRWNVQLQPVHLPGVDNLIADRLSRIDPPSNEWSLSKSAFDLICDEFGRPTIDWFAAHRNALLPRYAARRVDLNATFIDAFSTSWSNEFGLWVPPINLIPRVVQRIISDDAHGVLVVPAWPSRPWWAQVTALARRQILLPYSAMVPAPQGRHPLRDQSAPPLVALLV